MNTVVVQKDEIRLSSGLNEYSFGKTNYFESMSENGLIFENNGFEKWNFTDVCAFMDNVKTEKPSEESDSEETVFYCGKNPLSEKANTLLNFFEEGGEKLFNAVMIVVNAMTNAVKNDIKLPAVGAGGIIIDIENKKALFLPEDIFKYSTNLLSREQYFSENSGWTNVTITDTPAICYERALIVYKLLTKRFPYPAIDETDRNADILDKNFLPLELCIEGINPEFAKEINKALELNSVTVSVSSHNDKEDLIIHRDFNTDQLKEAWELSKKVLISEDQLTEKASSYIKAQKAKIEAKRRFRRNTTAFTIAACSVILLIIMSISFSLKQNRQLTPMGLTSTEVIQGFFQGINTKSTKQMTVLSKGPVPEHFINNIAEVYILEKQIASFTRGTTVYASPEKWLLNITDDNKFAQIRVFGVSNLKIDGMPAELNVEIYRRNQNPEAVTFEDGKELAQKDEVKHKVEYYLIQTNPEDSSIVVQKVREDYTLTYMNKCWYITDIYSSQEDIPVDTEQFRKDYAAAFEKSNSLQEFIDELQDNYKWLPSDFAVEQEYMRMLAEA